MAMEFDEINIEKLSKLQYLLEAMKDFPKEQNLVRFTIRGEPYLYLYYDFDEINEWYAKWLQAPAEDLSYGGV